MRRLLLLAVLAGALVGLVGSSDAFGSVLIARSAKDVKLKVTPNGKALISFKKQGEQRYILAWGALNARPHPKCGKIQGRPCGPRQVDMKHRRIFASGHKFGKIINGPNKCKKYDGPELMWLVVACRAPDGTYWALQSWVRLHRPCTRESAGVPELRLSHWSGPLEKVRVFQSWKKRKRQYYDHIWGWISYQGKPVYGLRWNGIGVPLDGFGRVIYFDTLDSGCGGGWRRAEGFLSKPWSGQFCYTTWLDNEDAMGEMYRATAMGVGVTPDVFVEPFASNHVFDPVWQQQAFAKLKSLSMGSRFCRPQPIR